MKVLVQFQNLNNARYYAKIKNYKESGYRHGIESVYLIERTMEGYPLTIEEMKCCNIDDEISLFHSAFCYGL